MPRSASKANCNEYNRSLPCKDIWRTNTITKTQIVYGQWKYRDKVLKKKKHKVILFRELSRRKSISATQYLFKLRRCPKRRAHCALSSSQNWKSWQQLIAANQIWAKLLLIVPFWNITNVNVVAANPIWDRQNFVQQRSFSLRVICTLKNYIWPQKRWDHH